ncbi:sensor histidine kinase [Chrysiogenes arsenatis]|uniref:sensor histidine kinase n=1 Tax=Chrysiogenes arsenatis TaxID=309797 RepID=UPI0003F4BD6C|nr:ATP-binding protein [Chrysiogenes arsenatis]
MQQRPTSLYLGAVGALAAIVAFNILFFVEAKEQGVFPNLSVFFFANINLLLFIILAFFAFRSYVKLMIERRQGHFGAKFQTRLVLILTALPLIPIILLALFASGIIGNTIEKWMNDQVDRGLEHGLDIARHYYDRLENDVTEKGGYIAANLPSTGLTNLDRLDAYLYAQKSQRGVDYIALLSPTGDQIASSGISPEIIRDAIALPMYPTSYTARGASHVVSVHQKKFPQHAEPFYIVVAIAAPTGLADQVIALQNATIDYRSLKIHRDPLKWGYYLALAFFSLLVLFGSIWSGTYIARRITVPIQELAAATRRVSEGDLNIQVQVKAEDEISTLIESFNRMTQDLRLYKEAMERSNRELLKTNIILEETRLFQEVVLRSISTGVISRNPAGEVTFINTTAARILELEPPSDSATPFPDEWSPQSPLAILLRSIETLRQEGESELKGESVVHSGGKDRTLFFEVIALYAAEEQRYLGEVIVFDDMSAVIRSQRLMAWRDVARKIAHEIRNPLTPIKLSTERLLKKYDALSPEEFKSLLEKSSKTIIQHVDTIRLMVDEFSQYARMPKATLEQGDILLAIQEVLDLYANSHPDIHFEVNVEGDLPLLPFDHEQMRRVFVNLFENGVAAMEGTGWCKTTIIRKKFSLEIHITDSGEGIKESDLAKVFEPYFTTKDGGSGLGLAIVRRIIEDHSGTIIAINSPTGITTFVIELPLASTQ